MPRGVYPRKKNGQSVSSLIRENSELKMKYKELTHKYISIRVEVAELKLQLAVLQRDSFIEGERDDSDNGVLGETGIG